MAKSLSEIFNQQAQQTQKPSLESIFGTNSTQPKENYISRVAGDFKQAGQNIINTVQHGADVLGQPTPDTTGGKLKQAGSQLLSLGETGVNTVGAVAGAAFAPITEAIAPVVAPVVKKIAEIPGVSGAISKVDEWAKSHPQAAQDLQSVIDIATLGVGGAGEKIAKDVAVKTGELVGKGVDATGKVVSNAAKTITGVAGEVIPNAERIVNEQVTKGLQLTAGDVSNIEQSTGNVVGQFMAENNLIGSNLKDTQKMLNTFYDTNYKTVRSEIAKVKNTYLPKEIPRYKQALSELKSQIDGVAGQENNLKEVNSLLKKSQIQLSDVQKVKELSDKLYSLYTVAGDVKAGVAKQGLAQIRSELKSFIENEVKKSTGADISKLNNNVSTSKSILDAAEARAQSGLTKSHWKIGDLGLFGTGSYLSGSPLVGGALLLGKKIIESPAIRFRMAKFIDKLSDARKLRIEKELAKGEVPKELEKLAQLSEGKNTSNATTIKNSKNPAISSTIPKTVKKSSVLKNKK